MAKQPFEPSDFPAGERQLDIAIYHVKKIQSQFGTHLADHVITQLDDLHTHLTDAIDARDSDARLEAIKSAQERVEKLKSDSAFNAGHTMALENTVENMLNRATQFVVDSQE